MGLSARVGLSNQHRVLSVALWVVILQLVRAVVRSLVESDLSSCQYNRPRAMRGLGVTAVLLLLRKFEGLALATNHLHG